MCCCSFRLSWLASDRDGRRFTLGSRWTRVLHFASAELVGKDVPIGRSLCLFKETELMCCIQAEHNVLNGAIGGMDSSYYAFCGVGA
jgi:hypothetical protein